MKRVTLGQTDIETSTLGFGCVQLTSHPSPKEAVTTLEQAYAAGITHFDVARAYGSGRAESILAEFLAHKRRHITVATKFGFEMTSGLKGNPKLISLAKKVLKPFPKLLQRAKNHRTSRAQRGVFTPEMAVKSLEQSLQELKTDYIDILLLQEAMFADATNEELIDTLRQQVAKGTIRCFGVASDFNKLSEKINNVPSAHKVLQFNDNIVEQNLQKISPRISQGLITHSIFKPMLILLKSIADHPEHTAKYSRLIDLDLKDPQVLTHLLLQYALRNNTDGVVLFSSMNPDHIKTNVSALEKPLCDDHQLSAFIEFINKVASYDY